MMLNETLKPLEYGLRKLIVLASTLWFLWDLIAVRGKKISTTLFFPNMKVQSRSVAVSPNSSQNIDICWLSYCFLMVTFMFCLLFLTTFMLQLLVLPKCKLSRLNPHN